MTNELLQLPISALSGMIAERRLSSEELVKACFERISEREATIKAWAHLDPDLALEQARRRDAEAPKGPLHGVPVGVKDVIDTRDMPTRRGTSIYADRRPGVDATCVARLREKGAVILGKTTTTEFATWTPSDTTNPHNSSHTPGGSSSGSAAAVAAGMVPLALGTQTVGSTIRPAAFCGVIGMKPSFGFVPMAGVNVTSQRLDTIGLFAKKPEDLAYLYAELGPSPESGPTPDLELVRVIETPWWDKADQNARSALARSWLALTAAGLRVEAAELPAGFEEIPELQNLIAHYDIANNLRQDYVLHASQFSDNLGTRMEEGLAIGPRSYGEALRRVDVLRAMLPRVLGSGEAIVMPAATGAAPSGIDWTGDPVFCQPWSMFGNPAATVPAHIDAATGLPVGVQLVGRFGDDQLVLRLAQTLHAALNEE
ncbi:amidase [Saxibacter everestensis]|uniref:Amidase n=1 Tax=Saxibacter everestensis TaxID=2909229 RepID=A0ABY8QRY6_9MICO|nr:amidase [Brevibacteriaceae bacterium ZFBP1038]